MSKKEIVWPEVKPQKVRGEFCRAPECGAVYSRWSDANQNECAGGE